MVELHGYVSLGEKKDFEVYSCHISADGTRLVTAAGDSFVRIWSTEAIYRGSDPEFKGPRQLAALNHHTGTIHAARFSGNSRYLASGADDKFVCVYALDPNPPTHTTFGSNEQPPVENWRIFRRLIGHENDIQDLGWSCDSSILVSVGLDSRIVVWSGYTFEKLKTISSHSSHVKGITFDPANKYFATASDDRTIKIFRYTSPQPNSTAQDQVENFVQEASIVDPFQTSPLSTYFRRCSWSPDGVHIAAANATNGPVSTAAIINRGTWDSDINLIGHEGPLEVCAFSPRIFAKTPVDPASPQVPPGSTSTVIACGGQDRALSLWNTASSKPLVVFDGLCMKSISDLAWAPNGESCFFTSLDGSIAVASFGPGELGYPMPAEYNDQSLAKYGAGRKVGVIEGPDGWVLEELSKEDEMRNVRGRMGELMGDPHSIVNGMTNGIHANGKATDSSFKSQEKDITMTNGQVEGSDSKKPIAEDSNAAKIERLKQKVTVTKDGKKRVAPLLVSSTAGSQESSMPTAQLMAATSQSKNANEAPQSILDLSKPYDGLPRGGLTSMLAGNRRKLAETGSDDDSSIRQRVDSMERQGAVPIMANTADGLKPASRSVMQATIPVTAPTHPSQHISQIRLATPVTRSNIVRSLDGIVRSTENPEQDRASVNEDSHQLEVRNPPARSLTGRVQDREPARVVVSKRGQQLWQDFLPRPVLLVTGNKRFWAAACDDGTLVTWTPAGRRLFNTFLLEAQCVMLDSRGSWLLAITAVGLCYVWNMDKCTAAHPPISVAPILDAAAISQQPHLTGGPGIIFARLNSEGRIIVGMSNGDGFTYSTQMQVWQRLSEQWWAVGSQYWNTSVSEPGLAQNSRILGKGASHDDDKNETVRLENLSGGIIPYLERNTTSHTLLPGKAYFLQRLVRALLSAEGYEGFEAGVSVAHLENRLAAALTLGAKDEFKTYLNMYAKRLGNEGARLKIEELLRSLITSVFDNQSTSNDVSLLRDSSNSYLGGTTNELCGWKKEALLKDVVLILGKYRDLQRIILPYGRVLGMTDAEVQAAVEGDEVMNE
ncbi:MAG: hypothetical protein Q9162_004762 [Coniocarpon cinnabarinum]